MLLEWGVIWPAPSRYCEKPYIFFDYLKVHNELRKVKKFGTSLCVFFMEKKEHYQ